jgi:hypothetical protein
MVFPRPSEKMLAQHLALDHDYYSLESFPTHYSLIIIPFNVIKSQEIKVSLDTPII